MFSSKVDTPGVFSKPKRKIKKLCSNFFLKFPKKENLYSAMDAD